MNKICISVAILIIFLTGSSGALAQGDWSDWKHRMPITLVERTGELAGLVPVDVTFSLFAEECRNPQNELRLIIRTRGEEREVPFQLSNLSMWTKDTGNRSRPTVNGMITFFDEAEGNRDAEYFLLYGNPEAKAPVYPTDLTVSGQNPGWTIENNKMTVRLRSRTPGTPDRSNRDSGQLASVVLKERTDFPISSNYGVIHWNPGIFIPERGWIHAHAWDPPEICEIEEGPLFVKVTRSGAFPQIPEAHLSITYRIFTDRSYIESSTRVEIRETVGVVSLRNDQLIFDKGFFSNIGWDDKGTVVTRRLDDYKPVNSHGDILRFRDDAAFVTFYDPRKRIGAASIRDFYANTGPDGAVPTLFDNSTYIANNSLQYWFRPLVYFHVGWDRRQLITVPKGSIYSERNLYYFYEPDTEENIKQVIDLSRAVKNRPMVDIGPGVLPPAK